MSRVRVYMACSLDGYVAGPGDDLAWLGEAAGSVDPEAPTDALDFATFIGGMGAMIMGRRTYDVVEPMGQWHYGQLPVMVATTRPLEKTRDTVWAAAGTIEELVAQARLVARDKDIYIDGGALVRQALDAKLVDELVLTMVPILLGDGVPLFKGLTERHSLTFVKTATYGSMLQLTLRPVAQSTAGSSTQANPLEN
ncbi:MAG: dihydrofolate reductase [Deltaproteobacteria bacterium]|nr:dihydrofolate reductase [Deltaproteobacteria bacterium]